MRGTKVRNASCQRCEHPGFPGARSVCNVLVPWTNPSPARGTGVHCGTAKGPLGFQGVRRGSGGSLEGALTALRLHLQPVRDPRPPPLCVALDDEHRALPPLALLRIGRVQRLQFA
eukprot:1185773-Prorocentrum_minimum.AAC.1